MQILEVLCKSTISNHIYCFVTAFAFEFCILRLVLELWLFFYLHIMFLICGLVWSFTFEFYFWFLVVELLCWNYLLAGADQVIIFLSCVLLLVWALAFEFSLLWLVLIHWLFLYFDFLRLEVLFILCLWVKWNFGFSGVVAFDQGVRSPETSVLWGWHLWFDILHFITGLKYFRVVVLRFWFRNIVSGSSLNSIRFIISLCGSFSLELGSLLPQIRVIASACTTMCMTWWGFCHFPNIFISLII